MVEERGLQMRRALERKDAQQAVEGLISGVRRELQETSEQEEHIDQIVAELTFDDLDDAWTVINLLQHCYNIVKRRPFYTSIHP
jgi:predicted transcriptional regulator